MRGASGLIAAMPAPVAGGLLMTLTALCYATTAVCVRLMTEELNPLMIGLLRNGFGLLFFMPMIVGASGTILRSSHWPLHLARTLFAVISGLLWFWALPMIPLSDAVALNFTGPIFVAIGAVLFLGERMSGPRRLAIALAFLGALVIIRPGFAEISLGIPIVLVSAAIWAAMVLANKMLSRTETTAQIVMLNLLIAAPVSLILALPVWQTPSLWMIALGAVQGLLGTTAHYFMARAFQIADASYVMPFDFLRLPFAATLAFFLFAEHPDVWTMAGAAIIFAATIHVTRKERQAMRK